MTTPALGAVIAAAGFVGAISCTAADHDRSGAYWRTDEAESISTVRGMTVRVTACRGCGQAEIDDGVRRYRRFRCVAGARAPWQQYDTVAVRYVVHPLAPYVGSRSRYALREVRFVGGPGIP